MRPARLAAALVIAGALGAAADALASEPPPAAAPPGSVAPSSSSARVEAAARFEEAARAEAEGRFAEALALYREALAHDPSARLAGAARARAAEIEAHAEGGFAPLAKLEAMRRDPARRDDRAAIEAFEREIRGFPEGRVRAEAALLVAEAWRRRLDAPRRAIAPLALAVEDAAADRLTRALALAELAALFQDLGELAEARALVDRYPDLSPATRAEILRLCRRAWLRAASIAWLAALAVVGFASLVRAGRRLGGARGVQRAVVRPLAVASALYLGGAAAALARLHGEGDPRPFLWLGLGVLAVDMVARAWRLASDDPRPSRRAARAAACAAGVLAAAFLSIERTSAGYLESFGL